MTGALVYVCLPAGTPESGIPRARASALDAHRPRWGRWEPSPICSGARTAEGAARDERRYARLGDITPSAMAEGGVEVVIDLRGKWITGYRFREMTVPVPEGTWIAAVITHI
jgi:hypothetical protein